MLGGAAHGDESLDGLDELIGGARAADADGQGFAGELASTIVASLIRRRSAVSSNWKSTSHT